MSDRWECGATSFALDRPLIMGVLNVTPDSFSDGGEYLYPEAALRRGREMLAAGADIIDVGGESTRPGSDPVDTDQELFRVRPIIAALAAEGANVSVDTRHARVAEACVRSGACIINDVSGFRDSEMIAVAARCSAGIVIMHMLGEPKTMQDTPVYDDVVATVRDYLARRAEDLRAAGIAPGRIAVDPGIGFGKTLAHNLELLGRLGEIVELGYPVVAGVSRKRFIGSIVGRETPRERTWGSVGAAVACAERGASVVRVHDVGETIDALKVAHAIRIGGVAW